MRRCEAVSEAGATYEDHVVLLGHDGGVVAVQVEAVDLGLAVLVEHDAQGDLVDRVVQELLEGAAQYVFVGDDLVELLVEGEGAFGAGLAVFHF